MAEVMYWWATWVTISFMMRPTAADRALFRIACYNYTYYKALLWGGAGCYYDAQVRHSFPELMDKFGSMGALNAQAMEGTQNLQQHRLRHAGFGARGRPRNIAKAAGTVADEMQVSHYHLLQAYHRSTLTLLLVRT